MSTSFQIYTDGAMCQGIFGYAAWLVVSVPGNVVRSVAKVGLCTKGPFTAQRAELCGAAAGLLMALECPKSEEIFLFSDSKYVVNSLGAMNYLGKWRNDGTLKTRLHSDMLISLYHLRTKVQEKHGKYSLKVRHVPGHAGVFMNEAADSLAGAVVRSGTVQATIEMPVDLCLSAQIEYAKTQLVPKETVAA